MFTCKLNGHQYEFFYNTETQEFDIRYLMPHDVQYPALKFFNAIKDENNPEASSTHVGRVKLFKPEMDANFNRWFQSTTKSPCKAILIKHQIEDLALTLFGPVKDGYDFQNPSYMDIENCDAGAIMNYYFRRLDFDMKWNHHGPTIVNIVNGLNPIFKALPFYPRYNIGAVVKVIADTFICGNNIRGTVWAIENWDRVLNQYNLRSADDSYTARSIPERSLRFIKK